MYRTIYDQIRKYNVNTIKWYLDYLGLKRYVNVTYPHKDIKIIARAHLQWHLLEKKQWEYKSLGLISGMIDNDQNIIDVGSYIGGYTLFISKLLNETGKVYSFEPDPRAFKILKDNIRKNELKNIQPEEIALSNTIGATKLKASVLGISRSSLIDKYSKKKQREITVKAITMDKYCEDNDFVPDGIKIDVEGGETLVIESAKNTIKKHSPWILLEFHSNFMSETDGIKNWEKCTGFAKEIMYVEGPSDKYSYGDEVKELPSNKTFIVLLKNR